MACHAYVHFADLTSLFLGKISVYKERFISGFTSEHRADTKLNKGYLWLVFCGVLRIGSKMSCLMLSVTVWTGVLNSLVGIS